MTGGGALPECRKPGYFFDRAWRRVRERPKEDRSPTYPERIFRTYELVLSPVRKSKARRQNREQGLFD